MDKEEKLQAGLIDTSIKVFQKRPIEVETEVLKIRVINNANKQYEIYKKKYGTTKTFLAEKMGVSRQHLHTILVSDSITLENVIKLAVIFECNLDDIVSYEIL